MPATVKVSSKYQIVIPKEIRKPMGLKPGQELCIFRFGEMLQIVPVKPMEEMRGFISGIDSYIEREPDREL